MTYDPGIGDRPDRDSGSRRASRVDRNALVGLLAFATALIVASAASFAGEAGDGDVDKALLGTRDHSTVRGDIYEELKANAGGPYKVRRGGTVKLDGSGSRPRKKIDSYVWTFGNAQNCDVDPKPGVKKGKTANAVILCTISVTLTVSGSGGSDTDTTKIRVVPRKLDVPFDQDGSDDVNLPFAQPSGGGLCEGCFFFGANRCSVEWPRHRDVDRTNHWLHPTDDSDKPRFKLKQVSDANGPFNNYWYLGELDLRLTRTIIVNSKLLKGGSVYRLNQGNDARAADLETLVQSTRTHERIHGQLARGQLDGKDANALERAMGDDRDQLQLLVGGLIGNLENAMIDASSEANVTRQMRKIYKNQKAMIIVPVSGGGTTKRTFVLAEKGATG